jgi:DNA-directed RNA polymerase specialized sigma24 family protein
VIVLARVEELKIREIAERMERSESAVKNLLLRALRELRQNFGDTESLRLPDRSLSPGRDVEPPHAER